MYKEFQKKRFLKYCSENLYNKRTVDLIEKIFSSTEMAETQFEKDICEFSPLEVTEFLIGLNSRSRRRLQNTCVYLSKYHDWCYRVERLINSLIDPFDSRVVEPIIDSIIPKEDLNDQFYTKTKFLEMLKGVADVSNQFIVYAVYLGLSTKEISNLTINDLDFEGNKVNLFNGRVVEVDTLFKHLMIQTNDQEQYFPDGIEKDDVKKYYTYADSGYVVRTCRKNTIGAVNDKYIYQRFRVIKDQMENKFISITNVQKNGLINYIKEKFAERNIDLKTAILKPINGKVYLYDKDTQEYIDKFGSGITTRMLRMEIKDYMDLL